LILAQAEINKIYQELVRIGRVKSSFIIDSVTKNKSVRSRSGVLPISVATDGNNFSCAFDCHFCPDETVKNGAPRDMSRSYLSSEGTFIRGAIENFDGAGQIFRRLLELEMMGHPPDKCEMIILGGTWDSYDEKYRDYFINQIFYACNEFHRVSIRLNGDLSHFTREWVGLNPMQAGLRFDSLGKIAANLRPMLSLSEEKRINETSECARIIGIVLETRPDCINKRSLNRKRTLGCTRLQLGIQHTDDDILELNNRGHGVQKSRDALKFARDAAFKVDGHLMPDLPGTTPEKDYEMLSEVFGGEELQLDYCKLYPCLDLPYTVTRKWKEDGSWKPMAEHQYQEFLDILRHGMAICPPWTRINRVHRDFPEATVKNDYLGFVSENIKSNLQQHIVRELKSHGQACYDIRSREIANSFPVDCDSRARLFMRVYRANEGTEIFLSVEIPRTDAASPDDAMLLGLLRLRLNDVDCRRVRGEHPRIPQHYLNEFAEKPYARIRELHVYGNLKMVTREHTDRSNSQHTGVGKFLMASAESISRLCGFEHICVISGVGVRGYYRHRGYELTGGSGEYMVKNLSANEGLDKTPEFKLFGHTYSDYEMGDALMQAKLTNSCLSPEARTYVNSQRDSSNVLKHSVHTYAHIQDGRAQLVILGIPKTASRTAIDSNSMYLMLALLLMLLSMALKSIM
ncbi:hypothetical protein SARC_05509, partial [Sphaeroforma arctica JP610]